MISKFMYLEKMLRHFLIFGLLFVAINADGKFAVLQAPDSIKFEGEQPIPSVDVVDVILAATGNTVNGNAQWSGLSIVDPFHLPSKAVVALIEGAPIDVQSKQFEVPLESADVDYSLDMLVEEMGADHISTCDIDYSKKHASKTSHKCFGNVVQPKEKAALPATTALNAGDAVAKKFLSAIADLNDAVDNYLKLKENKAVEMRSIVVIRMSLEPIVQTYGADSAQHAEAVALVKNTIAKLQKAAGDALFIVLSGTDSAKSRSKRDTPTTDDKTALNLAEYYDTDYPVIFNIILWFMIVFGLSLLAISYAIGSMDPGKDSIIYRMTSTRMKKDN